MRVMRKGVANGITAPVILALVTAGVGVAGLLLWSTERTDAISVERQVQFVKHALQTSISTVAEEQETVTLWDGAVRFFSRPGWKLDNPPEILLKDADSHIDPFLHDLFGHDEVYILNGDNRTLYAMKDGKRAKPSDYQSISSITNPSVAKLRRIMYPLRLRAIEKNSPGTSDVAVLNGHLAIISVKPIISHTGTLIQPHGKEFVMVNIQRLDQEFVSYLSNRLLLEGTRFSLLDNRQSKETSAPLISSITGRPIGYFIWRPYKPGSTVFGDMILALLAGLMVVFAVTYSLIRKVRASTAQLQASEAQARHLAFHDVLTGLPNRALFDERMENALASVRSRETAQVALLYLDLDQFKRVNDTLGHPVGDELIREVARRLSGLLRKCDTAARLGGDEFAIIQCQARSKRDIDFLCERIQAALSAPFDLIGSQVHVSVSIGVARAPVDSLDRGELTRKADIALYHAKAAGRRCHRIFDKKMDTTIQVRQTIENDLREALVDGSQLHMHYQPQYDATSMDITGVEALVRWDHPRLGLLSPSTFIPVAEECGLIETLGEWVLKEACIAAKDWDKLLVSVNVSAVQLRNPNFAERVFKIAQAAQMNLHRLELEITETSLLDNLAQCEANLVALRAKGVKIALDDFGTGYSSLAHLRTFRVDRVKIDQSFIRGMEDLTGSAIVQAIVDLAQCTGLKVTAEGVETDAQSQFLRAAGCDELQGFGLSYPVSLAALDKLLIIDRETQEKRRIAA